MRLVFALVVVGALAWTAQGGSFSRAIGAIARSSKVRRLESLIFHGLTLADISMGVTHMVMKGCEYEPELCTIRPEIEKLEKQVEDISKNVKTKADELEALDTANNDMYTSVNQANQNNRAIRDILLRISEFSVDLMTTLAEVTSVQSVDVDQVKLDAYRLGTSADLAKDNVNALKDATEKYFKMYNTHFLALDLGPTLTYYAYLAGVEMKAYKKKHNAKPPKLANVDSGIQKSTASLGKSGGVLNKVRSNTKLKYMKTALNVAFRGTLYAASIANFVLTAKKSEEMLKSLKETKALLEEIIAKNTEVMTNMADNIAYEKTVKVDLENDYTEVAETYENGTDFLRQMHDFPEHLFSTAPTGMPTFSVDGLALSNILQRQVETLTFLLKWAETLDGVYDRIAAVSIVKKMQLDVTNMNSYIVLSICQSLDKTMVHDDVFRAIAFQYPTLTEYEGVNLAGYKS